MKRRLLDYLTLLSVLLFVAVLALWVWGRHSRDFLESPLFPMPILDGGVMLLWEGWASHLVVAWRAYDAWPPSYDEVAVPAWWLLVAFALLPGARALAAWRRKRRVPPGICRTCGYDLRATPGRCPECGREARPIAEPHAAVERVEA